MSKCPKGGIMCSKCGGPMQLEIISHDPVGGNEVAAKCTVCDKPPDNSLDAYSGV